MRLEGYVEMQAGLISKISAPIFTIIRQRNGSGIVMIHPGKTKTSCEKSSVEIPSGYTKKTGGGSKTGLELSIGEGLFSDVACFDPRDDFAMRFFIADRKLSA
jgi:hypothetical protein